MLSRLCLMEEVCFIHCTNRQVFAYMSQNKPSHQKLLIAFCLVAVATMAGTASYCFRNAQLDKKEYEAVFGGCLFPMDDQRNVAALLAKNGYTDYRWENDRLLVHPSARSKYEKILGENQALPSDPSDAKQKALTQMSQFESESKTRLRDLYSSARQLEQTLVRFEQIETATVGVWTRQEKEGLTQRTVTTATVGIRTREGIFELSPELISAVTMAAKHQLGIRNNEDIAIMDLRNGCSCLGNDRALGVRQEVRLAHESHRQEEEWRSKLEGALSYVPGLKVTPSVEISDSPQKTFASEQNSIQIGGNQGSAGTLVFRPSTDPEEGNERNSEKAPEAEKIAVVLSVPESYLREHGEGTLDTIQQTAQTILNSAKIDSDKCSVQVSPYADDPEPLADILQSVVPTQDESEIETLPIDSQNLTRLSAFLRWAQDFYKSHPHETILGTIVLAITQFFMGIVIWIRRVKNKALQKLTQGKENTNPEKEILQNETFSIEDEVSRRIRHDPQRASEVLQSWLKTGIQ